MPLPPGASGLAPRHAIVVPWFAAGILDLGDGDLDGDPLVVTKAALTMVRVLLVKAKATWKFWWT